MMRTLSEVREIRESQLVQGYRWNALVGAKAAPIVVLALFFATVPGCANLMVGTPATTQRARIPDLDGPPEQLATPPTPSATVPELIAAPPQALEPQSSEPTVPPTNATPTAVAKPDPETVPAVMETRRKPLVAALQAYLDNRPDAALEALQGFSTHHQEWMLLLLPLLARVDGKGLEEWNQEECQAALKTLRSLQSEVRRRAPLAIDKLTFCNRFRSFGQIEVRPHNVFRPTDQALLYVEVANLVDEPTPDGRFVIRLTCSLEIRNADGKVVKSIPVQPRPDYSETERMDHFALVLFQVPRDLDPGHYLLRVLLLDQDSQREVERDLSFRVAPVLPQSNP